MRTHLFKKTLMTKVDQLNRDSIHQVAVLDISLLNPDPKKVAREAIMGFLNEVGIDDFDTLGEHTLRINQVHSAKATLVEKALDGCVIDYNQAVLADVSGPQWLKQWFDERVVIDSCVRVKGPDGDEMPVLEDVEAEAQRWYRRWADQVAIMDGAQDIRADDLVTEWVEALRPAYRDDNPVALEDFCHDVLHAAGLLFCTEALKTFDSYVRWACVGHTYTSRYKALRSKAGERDAVSESEASMDKYLHKLAFAQGDVMDWRSIVNDPDIEGVLLLLADSRYEDRPLSVKPGSLVEKALQESDALEQEDASKPSDQSRPEIFRAMVISMARLMAKIEMFHLGSVIEERLSSDLDEGGPFEPFEDLFDKALSVALQRRNEQLGIAIPQYKR